jgi:hypothetical protein
MKSSFSGGTLFIVLIMSIWLISGVYFLLQVMTGNPPPYSTGGSRMYIEQDY